MEEERARQQAAGGEGNAADSSAATKPVDPMNIVEANTEEDAELAQALALSLAGGDTTMTDETTSSSTASH